LLLPGQIQIAFATNCFWIANATTPIALPAHEEDEIAAAKALALANSNVKELTATLDLLLGYTIDTELELMPPV